MIWVNQYGSNSWNRISKLSGKSEIKCHMRWMELNNRGRESGVWSEEEDRVLIQLVHQYGLQNWTQIAERLPGRIGKQCRERWHIHLDPNVRKDAWTIEEDKEIIRLNCIHGNKWSAIAKFLPGRTYNSIKNRFNSNLCRKLREEPFRSIRARVFGKEKSPRSKRNSGSD